MNPSVALCMIVRDEEAVLGRCLESAAAGVDAIYITDTGSRDGTIEVARRHGAQVRSFTWCDDFSAARNASIQDVAEDWMLILDADDCFPTGEAGRLRGWLAGSDALALTVRYQAMPGYTPVPTRRVLRNHCGLRFEGIIHESIRASLPAPPARHTVDTDIQLTHLGYSAASLPVKLRRNLPLLQREWARCQAGADACQRMHVGRELAMTHFQTGEHETGERLLLELLDARAGHPVDDEAGLEALATLLWHYQETGRDRDAWALCERHGPRFANVPAYSLYRGLVLFRLQRFDEALVDLEAFGQHWLAGRVATSVPEACTGIALWDLQGQCCLHANRGTDATRLFEQCLAHGGNADEYSVKLRLARRSP